LVVVPGATARSHFVQVPAVVSPHPSPPMNKHACCQPADPFATMRCAHQRVRANFNEAFTMLGNFGTNKKTHKRQPFLYFDSSVRSASSRISFFFFNQVLIFFSKHSFYSIECVGPAG
jgi:hypothetical protein